MEIKEKITLGQMFEISNATGIFTSGCVISATVEMQNKSICADVALDELAGAQDILDAERQIAVKYRLSKMKITPNGRYFHFYLFSL